MTNPTRSREEEEGRNIVKMLFPLSCANSYKVEADGRCYSTECMLNTNVELAERIKRKGCRVYANHPEVRYAMIAQLKHHCEDKTWEQKGI